MGDVYVQIAGFSSENIKEFPKLKAAAPKEMNSAANAAVKETRGFTSKGSGEGYAISGNLTKITRETKGNEDIYKCVVSMILSELPSETILTSKLEGTAKATATTSTREKDILADAVACAAGGAAAGTKAALKYIQGLQKKP